MNYSFEYIDIILLAMIAGFIFLRLRGILGKRTGFDGKLSSKPEKNFSENIIINKLESNNFDETAQKDFLVGAKIAYEQIITEFASGNLKNIKSLLDKKIYNQFNDALNERKDKGHISETIFIGINSALIKEHKKNDNMLEVTVEFVSEIISVKKDKDNKVVEGDPNKIRTVIDHWKFTKKISSPSPNWYLAEIKNS